MKNTTMLVLLALFAAPASAIELSLEENRAERGTAGYVDMQRLFKGSPDAARAREGLEELVRQAEERVNSRKADLLRLRQDLETLKSDRETLAKSTPTPVAAPVTAPLQNPAAVPAPAPAAPVAQTPTPPAPTPAPAPAATPANDGPPAPRPGVTPENEEPASVTALPPAQTREQLMINLPGLTNGPLNLSEPPKGPAEPAVAAQPPAPIPEPTPAPEQPKAVAPAAPAEQAKLPEPVQPPAPVVPAGPTIAQRLMELDGLIVSKQADIARGEAELDRERLAAERSLLDAEGRKTDQVLARLYRAITEVARREGVSVVLDKGTTLYGHPAVDLTDKVLKQLKGAALQ